MGGGGIKQTKILGGVKAKETKKRVLKLQHK
jgi:hypothetical protein